MPFPSETLLPTETLSPGGIDSLFGQMLAEALAPWMTEDLERVCETVGAMGFDALLALIAEEGTDGQPGFVPAWGRLFDVDACPLADMPYLAQYVGVTVPAGLGEAEARALVKEEPATKRGGLGAIEVAVRKNLSGAKMFTIIERRNPEGAEDGYWFLVIVSPSELVSEAALKAAVNEAKPGGVMWTLIVSEGFEWSTATRNWEAETMTWEEAAHIAP